MAVNQFAVPLARYAWALFAGLTFVAVTAPTLLLLCLLPKQAWRRRLVRGAARLALGACGVLPRVSGLQHFPDGACVVVANHASNLDGIILTAALPARFAFVIKREMTRVPLAHFLLRRVGSEFLERERTAQGASDARRILQLAAAGESLVFFPEGTFRAAPGLYRFHLGAFNAARRGGLPLVPVAILGSRAMLPDDRRIPRPGPLRVVVQPAVPVDGNSTGKELVALCRQQILDVLDEPDLDRAATDVLGLTWSEPHNSAGQPSQIPIASQSKEHL